MSTPTPEQFLAQPYDPDEDFEAAEAGPVDPLVSIAASLGMIAAATQHKRIVAERDAEAADLHGEELRQLGEAYDDLEDKHRALYELLADVEKLVAKSKSQLANSVRDAINAWRNPVVEAEVPDESTGEPGQRATSAETHGGYTSGPSLPSTAVMFGGSAPKAPEPPSPPAVQCPACTRYFVDQALLDLHNCTAVPLADAPVGEWRKYARSKGYTDADQMNRSQIRTLLGLPHFDAQA